MPLFLSFPTIKKSFPTFSQKALFSRKNQHKWSVLDTSRAALVMGIVWLWLERSDGGGAIWSVWPVDGYGDRCVIKSGK